MKTLSICLWTTLFVAALSLSTAFAAPRQAAGQTVQITNGPIIESADDHSATIAWSTNVSSSSRIWYGTEMNNLTQIAEAPYSSGTTHRVQINNLKPSTAYYFEVESGQGRGARGEAESAGFSSFRTVASGQQPVRNQKALTAEAEPGETSGKVQITNGPVIERLTSNDATIAWSTNRRGSTRVNYGTDPNNLTQLAESPWGKGGDTHRVELRNLQPNTTYYFSVETGQAEGTGGAEIESPKSMSFKTPPAGAPAQSNVHPH